MPAAPTSRPSRRPRPLWLLALAVVACQPVARDDARPLVAVSVQPLAYFVDRLAGERARVEIMVPPGASPHMWEPSLEQVRAAHSAAPYIKVGHPHFAFEQTWLRRLLETSSELPVVDCGAGAEDLEGDPHLWVSPRAARRFVPAIAAALRERLPQDAAAVTANELELLAAIDALDAVLAQTLAPVRGHRFYVFHPAWGYLARDYGLEQIAIEEGSKEPSAAELAALIRDATTAGAKVVFVQPQFSERSAHVVASELGARLVSLDPLSRDWPQSLRSAAKELAAGSVPAR